MLKGAVGVFIVAIIVLIAFLPSYTKMQDLKQKNLDYKRQIEQLQAQKTQLTEEKRLLESDPVYLEKVARERMGLIKEGEVVYRITPATVNAEVPKKPIEKKKTSATTQPK